MTPEITAPKLELPEDRPPIFVGAGIIKKEAQISLYAGIPEIAVQVLGSFSEEENNPPGDGRLFYYDEENKAAYNAFRLRNPGSKEAGRYLPEGIKIIHEAGQLAIVSIVALERENPLEVLPRLTQWARNTGADGIEVNVSCPNAGDDLVCNNASRTLEIFDVVRGAAGDDFYVIGKFSAIDEVTRTRYKKEGLAANGVAAINGPKTLSPPNPETNGPVIEVNDGYAGTSGPIIATLAKENLQSWLSHRSGSHYDGWSIGGIENGYEGYHRVHDLGALAFGGAQAFYKAPHPGPVARQWARQYMASE